MVKIEKVTKLKVLDKLMSEFKKSNEGFTPNTAQQVMTVGISGAYVVANKCICSWVETSDKLLPNSCLVINE